MDIMNTGAEIGIRITFTEPILGTAPNNQDIYRDFIASRAPDAATIEDEIESVGVDGVSEKGMTVFPRAKDGTPILYDYQVKGFFKGACSMLRSIAGSESAKLKAYKKEIDGRIFVFPRKIPIHISGELDTCQRPLRASTPQGERVSLASSEEIPEGSTIEFSVMCLDKARLNTVIEWLDYGQLSGIGQWRNSGKGRFRYEILWKKVKKDKEED